MVSVKTADAVYAWNKDACKHADPTEKIEKPVIEKPQIEKKKCGCQHTDIRKRRYSDTYICCEMLKTHTGKPGVFACGIILNEIPHDGIARYVDGNLQILPTRKRRVTDSDAKTIRIVLESTKHEIA